MEELYLIQKRQKRGWGGNCLEWWKENDCGYTLNIDKARRFSEQEALEIVKGVHSDKVMHKLSDIEDISQRHVNSESEKWVKYFKEQE